MAILSTTSPRSSSPPSDSTAPSAPWSTASSVINATKPSKDCTSLSCPVNHPHSRGPYLHSCRVALSPESMRIFAPSAPPPDVLAAYERCIRNDGRRTDEEMWVKFHEFHVGSLLEHTDAVWVSPVPMRPCDDDIKIDGRADWDGAEDDGGAERCRHPFGLHNPPEKVWEAHRRLALGVKDLKDEEWVSAYAAKNAYYGEGLGQYKSMSRRFQVRRPRYSPSLAKERRIKKELESKQIKIETRN